MCPTRDQEAAGSIPVVSGNIVAIDHEIVLQSFSIHSFAEIDHEIFSTVILSLPLIQEGQLSVSRRKNVHNTG